MARSKKMTDVEPVEIEAELEAEHEVEFVTISEGLPLLNENTYENYHLDDTGDERYNHDDSLVTGYRHVPEPDQSDVPLGYRRSITDASQVVPI